MYDIIIVVLNDSHIIFYIPVVDTYNNPHIYD